MTFNPIDFVKRAGRRLVQEFDDANQSATPGLIGASKEHPARKQLERLLPHASAVGSGIVIDSVGHRSKQQDIVIYERSNCPVFSVNETPEATFYPCECVIAVGEVKSAIGTSELRDAFEKIASVKSLKRRSVEDLGLAGNSVPFRKFGSVLSMLGTPDEGFDQSLNGLDQVFGFVLCGNLKISPEKALNNIATFTRDFSPGLSPSAIVSLADGIFHFCSSAKAELSPMGSTAVVFTKEPERGFGFLVQRLSYVIREGRTVALKELDQYLLGPEHDRLAIAQKCDLKL